MRNKSQLSVRLDRVHFKELEDLTPHYGTTRGEVARFLLIEALQDKHGLDRLREKKAIH